MTVYRDESSLKLLLGAGGLLCTSCCGWIPSECAFCEGFQPGKVQLDFSSFVDIGPATCVKLPFSIAVWAKYNTGIAALLNGSHDLDHVSGCVYYKYIGIDYDWVRYLNSICTTGESPQNSTEMRIAAVAFAAYVRVTVTFTQGAGTTIFDGYVSYTGDDSCFRTGNTGNNTVIGGPCASGGRWRGHWVCRGYGVMGCCGKVKQIVKGYVNLARGKDYEFTVARIKTCHKCDEQYWVGRRLFCSKCKCYIPAKARVEENTCPLKKWEK